MRFKPMDMVSE